MTEAEKEGDRRQTRQKEMMVGNPFSSSGPAYMHTSFLLFWWRSENKKENTRLPHDTQQVRMFTGSYVYRQMQYFWCRSVSDKFNENQYGGGFLSKMAEVFKWFLIW